jgi:hypothetical protein
MRSAPLLCAALVSLSLCASTASADDKGKSKADKSAKGRARVLVVGKDTARFDVERDPATGRMTFHVVDPAVKIDRAPVVVMTTDSGPREIPLTVVEGKTDTWIWTDEVVKHDRFDGTLRVVVAGKAYDAPLSTVWVVESDEVVMVPRHGGRIIAMTDCGTNVEILQDRASGTLTLYPDDGVTLGEAPVITVEGTGKPMTISLTKVDGKGEQWTVQNDAFKTAATSARIRLLVNDKPCEAPLPIMSRHGGQIYTVVDGPTWEVVRDPKAGHYTFYTVEETYGGKTYVVENPSVVYGGRTYNLTRVEGEPRAWRLVGLDAAGTDSRDAQLNFTLFGKTLSTRLGLSGLGVDVK